MWMVNPVWLCMQHLSGEHNEIHKHRHNFEKGHSIAGRIAINACEPISMKTRHDELEAEIQRRARVAGRKPPHSPYEIPDLSYLSDEHRQLDDDVGLHENNKPCVEGMRNLSFSRPL
jgi:hypothetical protein